MVSRSSSARITTDSLRTSSQHTSSSSSSHIGAYAQLTPLSPLQLRIELGHVSVWPFFFDRAGYFGLAGYDADFRNDRLPAEDASSAQGWNLNLVAILRARIRIGSVGIVVMNQLNYEYWRVGEADFYLNLRRDVVMSRSDWVLYNEALLCLEINLNDDIAMRVGVFDAVKYVPRSGYLGHLIGGMVMFNWRRLSRGVYDLSPFVRVGGYTHHAFRRGTTAVTVGVIASYELYRLD